MANDVSIDSEKLDNFLANVTTHLESASKKIIDNLAELSLKEMQKNYSKAEHQAVESMDFTKKGTESEKIVAMSGPQAAYSEFGTGTRGQIQPHPRKNEFSLNPYNSGPTIRPATQKDSDASGIPPGELFWTYKDENGEKHYTQGIPAQKEVYDAGKTTLNKMPGIIKEELKEMFK